MKRRTPAWLILSPRGVAFARSYPTRAAAWANCPLGCAVDTETGARAP